MTTPNVNLETELYLPKTYVLERVGQSYDTSAPMTIVGKPGETYVPLPKGMSMVTVTSTGITSGMLQVVLRGPNAKVGLTPNEVVGEFTKRLWTGHLSARREGELHLNVFAEKITTHAMNIGSVSVQIINFPPET